MKKLLTIQGLMLVVIFHSAAQKNDSALNMLSTQFPPERIYIHYDKEYYVAGETIWFKAYLYSDGKPSVLSSTLCIQFIDDKNRNIITQKYPVLGAVAKGNIDLPDSLLEGNYTVRALTPAMLNEEDAFIYKKNIFVIKPHSTTATNIKQLQNLSLLFFPESG
ncbi:MAG TPA: hypothetical protein VN451_01890, partial [Chitinophagaceae bacterium]|nr:hypothetical protein [Chitinophagaceae bacterium]